MRIIIDDYGSYIHKKGNRFIISKESHQREFSADKVSQILVYKGAAISSAAIALAVENGVDIVFFDKMGKPFARTYSCKFENAASVRRLQVKAYDDKNIDISRQKLLGIEGEAARQYFSALKQVLPEEAYIGQRTRQPPQDLFNALLGYGYGILFTEIEKAVILSGLDPYMGFLHADRAGKPSMVLDMMEEWRQPIVDRSMITLVSRKVVQQNNLIHVEKGFYLDKFGKHKAVESVITRLNNIISYNNFRHSLSSLILMQARGVVKFISGENGFYTPFVYGR